MKAKIFKTSALGFIFLLLNAVQVRSATTGSITLSGVVPAATAIVVAGQGSYNALDLGTTATDLVVATIREINNTNNGYTVTLTSSNAGLLKNGTLGSVAYTAKYNNTAVTLSTTPFQVTSSGPSSSIVNILKQFKISYTGVDQSALMQGTYSDNLTFTISAN